MAKKKLSPADVAEALGISAQTVRVALQQGLFPFGWAVKTSRNRYVYAISPKLFDEYLGSFDGVLFKGAEDHEQVTT